VSSLQATSVPVLQFPERTYSTVSNAVAPHVENDAVPEVAGVHTKTFSGAPVVAATHPLRVLAPAVVPVKDPPLAGRAVAVAHASWVTALITIGAVTTLLVSLASDTRLNGSTVTRNV
jgi:hypothetical protein